MRHVIFSFTILSMFLFTGQVNLIGQADSPTYLDSIKGSLQVKWPKNKTINLVFHGHSVPTGYSTKGVVNTLESYPFLTLKKVKDLYPYAVVNCIITSIGGEQSEQGSARFRESVLNHKPDVLFIDYVLNDRRIGLERAEIAWSKMIEEAMEYGTKVVLLTPTPDLREDILSGSSELARFSEMIRRLAARYNVSLVDSYKVFQEIAGIQNLENYMAQNNHINGLGHDLVANELVKLFLK